MSHPLNELKRRLEDETTPLPKRFRLAKNVTFSDHFPTTPKERVIGQWLEDLTINKKITNKDFRDILSWLNGVDDFTVELKYKFIQIVVQYLHKNIILDEDLQHVIAFIENPKIAPQLSTQIKDYLSITMTLLQHLSNSEPNILLADKILNHITKYYKECRKKFEFIIKFLDEENLETIFGYINTKNENNVLNLCQNVLFPNNKRPFFIRYLNILIRKDNVSNLLEEKNDNMESVVKVLDAFIRFPNGRSSKDHQFLSNFIKVFVSCFKNESQLLFAFYIIAVNCLNINQTYINTVTKLTPIIFEENDEKIKCDIFLNMLEALLQNDVDVSVHLRDTLNEKSKETKKIFVLFLEDVMTGTLKMQGKLDKTHLNIIQIALKLDPSFIDQKILQILPPIMVSKKGSAILETYSETINILLQILFKLSKGVDFIHQMLPHLQNCLEKCDGKQAKLKDKLNQSISDDKYCEKIRSKIVNGYDIFPENCVELYGKLTSELMFRQNKELLLLLQMDLNECLCALEDGNSSSSHVALIEMLSAILSSFLRHNKMADHTVPLPIGEDFWMIYQNFENQCLKKFGESVLKTDDSPLLTSFLKICISFAELKVLNMKYSNIKLQFPEIQNNTEVNNLHSVLPCLSETQWKEIASKVNKENSDSLNKLLLVNSMALHIFNVKSQRDDINELMSNTKSHLIKQFSSTNMLDHDYFVNVLFKNLDKAQHKQLAKGLIKMYVNDQNIEMFKQDSVANNKMLLSTLVFEVAKNITKSFENASSLIKNLGKNFEITSFFKEVNVKEYFNNLMINSENFEDTVKYIEVLKHLHICYLDENCQLTAIFVLVTLKKCCNSKKIKRSIDYVLQSIFEISSKNPDLFKLFPVDFIFDFENGILELLKLNAKTSNQVFIVKNILETGVKKVKDEPEIVKNMVEILLNKFKRKSGDITSISHFNNEVFQIICILLPLIAKEKKNITKSAYRSILANLQENLHEAVLDSFKNVDFSQNIILNASNTDDSIISDNTMATLNAMGAYTLTLLKICEMGTEIKSVDCLWSGLEFFVQNAIQSIENAETKNLYVDLSMQLLNVILRYIKKLDTHNIFQDKDKLFLQIWRAVKSRLLIVLDHRQKRNNVCLEQIAITLKFLAELSSLEFFSNSIVADLNTLCILKKPSIILKNQEVTTSQIISRKLLKYLALNILKANIIDTKCTALEKLIFRSTRNIKFWIQQQYASGGEIQIGVDKLNVRVDDAICELLRIDLDILADVILAGKKISLDYKFIDAIFELQQLIHYILGRNITDTGCEVTWQSFFLLFEGSVAILNSMILSREELLEDRWPCFMQCYKTLVLCMLVRSTAQNNLDRVVEHKFAEIAHSIEKLTQSISKRKAHVSRIAAYAVADFCSWLEKKPPPKMIRQHLENSIVLLIQASDSNYAMAFLRRSLAGSIGQMTLTNMYTMYKRYHKYVGNA